MTEAIGHKPIKYTPVELGEAFETYKTSRLSRTKKVYDKRLKQVIEIEYDLPTTLISFCCFLGIHRDTLNSYKNEHSGYSDIIKNIYAECESDLVDKALGFQQHAGFTELILTNAHGYIKKQEIEHSGDLEIIVKKPE